MNENITVPEDTVASKRKSVHYHHIQQQIRCALKAECAQT